MLWVLKVFSSCRTASNLILIAGHTDHFKHRVGGAGGKAKKAEQPSTNRKWLSEGKFCSIKFIETIKTTDFSPKAALMHSYL